MATRIHDELTQHASALRSLARVLVGTRDAEDVVQDTALAALQRPPKRVEAMFGWLSAVLRHRALKQRRTEQRRARYENQVLPPEDQGEVASPLDAAQHRETVNRLDAALLGLVQPYQDTLLLRFFEDLTPSEIAARTNQPLATVKSRLQRGLTMLRQRLDADRGGDWRASLVVVFGLGARAEPVALTIGIALMTTKLLLGAVAAVFAYFLLWPPGDAPVAAPTFASRDDPASDQAPVPSMPNQLAPADRQEVAAATGPGATSVDAPITSGVSFSGRCVDESGAPLPGVRIEARTTRRNGGSALASKERVTGDDGVFEVELPVVDGAISRLVLRSGGRCPLEGAFQDAQPGERHRFGDLVMTLAHALRGRVVDATGAPQAGVHVQLSKDAAGQRNRPLLEVFVATTMRATTDDLGRFAFRDVLPTGSYRLRLGNRRLRDPSDRNVVLEASVVERVLQLVVDVAPAPCRGIVVGPDGSPIANAYVSLDQNRARTDTDGRFEVLPTPTVDEADRRLEVSAAGFLSNQDHTWPYGDAGEVRIVLQAIPQLKLRVVDGRTGAPVVRYAARLVFPNSWDTGHQVARGEHANGVSQFLAPSGRYFVVVAPVAQELQQSTFQPVVMPALRTAEVTVTLWPPLQRRLVVTDGRLPVAGAFVQLLDPGDQAVRCDTETWPLEDCRVGGLPLARIVQAGRTAADGSIALRGPKGPLALRLWGGGLALQIVQPVSLEGEGDLKIAGQRGATWRGKLFPATVARELAALGASRPNTKSKRVGLRLTSDRGESLHRFLERPFPIAADGSFEISGIPAGTWNAIVKGRSSYAAAKIQVAAGQVLEQDLDASALAAADVDLRILVDGVPAADCYVNVMGWHAKNVFGERFASQSLGRADSDGRFAVSTFVGDLALHITWPVAAGKTSQLCAYASVPRAGQQDLVLDLLLGTLDVRVLQADGSPAVGARLRESNRRAGAVWTADAKGRLVQVHFVAGSYEIEALPRSLSTRAARDSFTKLHGWQALQQQWMPCGVVTVLPGGARQQDLRLPEAWHR